MHGEDGRQRINFMIFKQSPIHAVAVGATHNVNVKTISLDHTTCNITLSAQTADFGFKLVHEAVHMGIDPENSK